MIKALYVDDDADIATVVELCLELDSDFKVDSVRSGKEALHIAELWKPNVILLDYMMPEMDGPTTFRHLRKNETTADIPVIFVTAKSMQEDIDMLLGMGATGVVSKPFDPTTLAKDVKTMLPHLAQR